MTPGDRLRLALELYDLGEALLRARLVRERPDISEEEIEAAILNWLHDRPGAEHGDAVGVRGAWPRSPA